VLASSHSTSDSGHFMLLNWAGMFVTILIFGLNLVWGLYVFVALYKEYKVAKFIVSVWNYFACSKCKKTGYEKESSGMNDGVESRSGIDSKGKSSGGGEWWGGGGKKPKAAAGGGSNDVELAKISNEVMNPLSTGKW
jgi:hypothetical protein